MACAHNINTDPTTDHTKKHALTSKASTRARAMTPLKAPGATPKQRGKTPTRPRRQPDGTSASERQPFESFRLQGDRLLVGRIILVSDENFFIFMIMNKKKRQILRKCRAKVKFAQYLLSSDQSETFYLHAQTTTHNQTNDAQRARDHACGRSRVPANPNTRQPPKAQQKSTEDTSASERRFASTSDTTFRSDEKRPTAI